MKVYHESFVTVPLDVPSRYRAWLMAAVFTAAAAYSVVHVLVSGVVQPLRADNVGQVVEELQPLYRLFTTGAATVDHPRQYGPIFLLLFHPVYRFTLSRPDILAWYAYGLDLLAIAVAFFATRRGIHVWAAARGITLSKWTTPALLFLWANFSPLYGVLAIKNVELWELALMAVAGTALLEQRRWLAGWSIGAAALVKMLPLALLPYLLLRDRRAFAYALVAIATTLTVSQLLYGDQMGFGYLPMILQAASGGEGFGNVHGMIWHENVSIRGLAFKAFGYLETPDPTAAHPYQLGYYVVVSDRLRPYAVAVSGVVFAAALAWLVARLFRNRSMRRADLLYWEWALMAIMMLVLAPQISQDYMVLTLGAFSYVMAGCLLRRDVSLWMQFTIAVLLVGNVLPRTIFGRLLLVDYGMSAAGHEHLQLAEAYQYFGFPLLGLLVLLRVWSRVADTDAPGRT
jgi:hypothetical protein